MASIRLEKVKKNFKDVTVTEGLDLTINEGEFFTFVGPSGCGKSTILNMIAGLEDVSGGSIYFDGNAVNKLSPQERDVAMVFQSYALYPHMTVYENMAFPLKMKKMRKKTIDNEVGKAASLLGLAELLNRKPGELSGGQRQRVALGRAIVRSPRVFLMDEPLSNLDARLRVEMRAELKRLHRELRITTVYVTHDQSEAMSLSDRVAVIDRGRIQQCGTPVEVYLKPANIFVGGFIGSPSMNFIQASVIKSEPLEIDCNGIIISPALEALPLKNNKVVIGIRPEDITVYDRKDGDLVEVEVLMLEPAGSFNWVDFVWKGCRIKGISKAYPDFGAGSRAFMKFAADKIVVFDADTGRRI